jgi:hypothetical protein
MVIHQISIEHRETMVMPGNLRDRIELVKTGVIHVICSSACFRSNTNETIPADWEAA